MHRDPKESSFTPICPPAVSPDPELNSIFLSPAHNCDLVIDQGQQFSLREDSTGISFKFGICIDTAWDGSSRINLGLHLISTRNWAILTHFPDRIFWLGPTVTFVSRFEACRRGAILASLNIGAAEMVRIFSNVSLAGLFWDAMSVSINVNFSGVASVAWPAGLAVDDHLRRQCHVWPRAIANDVDAIGNRASRTVCPARPTVGWDVLVSAPRQIVHATDVSPVPALGKSTYI